MSWDRCPSSAKHTQQLHSRLSADARFDGHHRTVKPSSFHLLFVTFALSFCDILGQGWICPSSGLSQGHVRGGFRSGPHRALQTLLVSSSEGFIPRTGREEGEIFIVSLAFIVLSNFPISFKNASRLTFGEGKRLRSLFKGKDSAVCVSDKLFLL